MMPSTPPRRGIVRAGALVAIPALLVAGLVTAAPAMATLTADPSVPDTAEIYHVEADSGSTSDAYLSPGGQRVAYVSTDSDLVIGDDNDVADVFLSTAQSTSEADAFSGAPELISAPDGPVGDVRADDASSSPVMSADGRWVAFTSMATNLVGPASPVELSSIYVRDTLKDTTIRLQVPGVMPNGPSYDPDMSDDGRYVVFTSEATNLSVDDVNGAADAFLADLDANGNGIRGDVKITRFLESNNLTGGSYEPVISGNGRWVAFVAGTDELYFFPAGNPGDYLYRAELRTLTVDAELIAPNATEPTIDANGSTLAYMQLGVCTPGKKSVIASSIDAGGTPFTVALGTIYTDERSGESWNPQISSDGSAVAWTTTVPFFDFDSTEPAAALTQPRIRSQRPGWWDSDRSATQCYGVTTNQWTDYAYGDGVTMSASGRTFAWTASDFTYVVDTNSNNGLSVTSTQGDLTTPDFISSIAISSIPLSNLRGYAGALANAPIHQLPIHQLPIHQLPIHQLPIHQLLIDDSPIHQLPIHQLPIHQLPIHQLPIHQLDLPGGWDQLLAGTTIDDLVPTLTLDEVLAWAAKTVAACPPEDDPSLSTECWAAWRVQSLTLGDVGIDGSGLDALSLASYVLGSAPLAEVPIAGDGEILTRWQSLADRQGLEIDVDTDPQMLLADLDAEGLDVSRAGLEDIVLTDLPVAKTLFRYLAIEDLFLTGTPLGELDVTTLTSTARGVLFGDAGATGTLASHDGHFADGARLSDLVAGLSTDVTFGTLLFSLLDRESFPWEEIDPASFDLTQVTDRSSTLDCADNDRCRSSADFRVTFDAGVGEGATFPIPTVSVTLPDGTQSTQLFVSGSGPGRSWSDFNEYTGSVVEDGGLVRVPFADVTSGTAISLGAWFSVTARPGSTQASAEVVTGTLTASTSLSTFATLKEIDDSRNNIESVGLDGLRPLLEGSVFYEWISPAWIDSGEDGRPTLAPVAGDADYYLADAPPPGKRLVISTNAKDGQVALALYSRSGAGAASLGLANAGVAPGTAVTEQSGIDGQPAESGSDAGSALPGQNLIDQAVMTGGGVAEVEAAAADTEPGERLIVRVTSGNGAPSSSMYSLRARYIDEPAETACSPFAAVQPLAEGVIGTSDGVDATTDTVYLFDQQRYGLRYGAAAATEVRAALERLSDPAVAGAGAVHGAVLSVDSDQGVRDARSELDKNPCSMTQRRALTSAINTYVGSALLGHRDHITSVVIVGGDDMIPFAPVGQHTADFTEQSHAGDLRLTEIAPGVPCPAQVAAGAQDPCSTPLSAAASGGFILTDDPYGLPDTYQSLGGYLYVPTVALGRLVETPEQIQATIAQYLGADGVLDVDSSVTGGYGAWSELPAIVTDQLKLRIPDESRHPLTGTWDAGALDSAVFGGAASPRVVSINTHADETRMLPGIEKAEAGVFRDDQLFHATEPSATDLESLRGALVFLIGCHAGNNLPGAYYGDVTDWVDVFSHAGGFVGNTGYGLANNVTTALSERLLGLYAGWVGTRVTTPTGDVPVSASGALTYAKQSYLGGVGLYSGYDEKVLMEAVYYGLPMYSVAGSTKEAPIPERPASLTPISTGNPDGLETAGLTFSPRFADPTSVTLPDGRTVEYLTAAPDETSSVQEPVAVAGQPVLPRLVSKLDAAPVDRKARGVLLTALTSEFDPSIVAPAIAEPNIGVDQTAADRSGAAFPSSYAAVSRQDTPTGPIDLLVVTPARVVIGQAGTGQVEKFTSMGLDVVYGPTEAIDAATPVEEVPPLVRSIELPPAGRQHVHIDADGTGSPIERIVLLIQPEGERDWVSVPVEKAEFEGWEGTVPTTGPFRWILQIADAYGNVTTETARGHLDEAAAPAPSPEDIGDLGEAEEIHAGGHVARTVSVGRAPSGDRLTGEILVTDADQRIVATGTAVVTTALDGSTTAQFDQIFRNPGQYTLTLRVCRGLQCSEKALPVVVTTTNELPSATVEILPETPVLPAATLTAEAVGTDEDELDVVTVSYAWYRNGSATGVSGPTLSLAAIDAQPGDVIQVAATPSDGKAVGHIAYDEVTVGTPPPPPPPPTIEATATNALGLYVGGQWSRSTVKVEFTCTGRGFVCPEPVFVSDDTGTTGVTVERSVTNAGGSMSASVFVKVDRTAPALAPIATPSSVDVGGTVTVDPHASDGGSGLVSPATCAVPSTTTPGANSVECTAIDNAGNIGKASATYTVTSPQAPTCAGGPDRAARAPLNPDGSSVFPRGSGVPVIFSACDAKGAPIGTKAFAKKVTLVTTAALSPQAGINELRYPTIKTFSYDKQTGLWTGNILTANLASGKKYTYRVDLADGTSFAVTFGVR